MKAVWKFPVEINDDLVLRMPKDSNVLTVQEQDGKAFLWAFCDPNEKIYETRRFRLAGTGHQMQDGHYQYIGTFQLHGGSFVGHLFEVL